MPARSKIPVNKILLEQQPLNPKLRLTFQCMNHYKLLNVRNVEVIAQPKELVKIVKSVEI
jgi:hypothetical protein